ncbi:unnamed protein product [Trichobilharzia szidati]|nr:unnamed protein product [Trichobilharzia szidati]CAH8847742.1 unnamed protein product [Trichobilharzia szidati]
MLVEAIIRHGTWSGVRRTWTSATLSKGATANDSFKSFNVRVALPRQLKIEVEEKLLSSMRRRIIRCYLCGPVAREYLCGVQTPFFCATPGRSHHYNRLSPQHTLRWLKRWAQVRSPSLRRRCYHGFGAQWYASISLRNNCMLVRARKFLLPRTALCVNESGAVRLEIFR